jgi:hypothetical protein
MSHKTLRRNFLTGVGTMFVLPLFEELFERESLAQAAADPRRFVSFYVPNGTYNRPDNATWSAPLGALSASTNFGAALSPFAANFADFSVVNGLPSDTDFRSADGYNPNAGHYSPAIYLTGETLGTGGANPTLATTSHSIDQHIADATKKDSIVLYGGNQYVSDEAPFLQNLSRWLSYRKGLAVQGMANPGDVYRRLLSQVVGTPMTAQNPMAKSVLDASIADLNRLKSQLGRSSQGKLDQYMESIRYAEKQLAGSGPGKLGTSAACVAPKLDPSLDTAEATTSDGYYARFRAFNEYIALAFACDIARAAVVSFDFEASERPETGSAAPNLVYSGAEVTGQYKHGMAHLQGMHALESCITRDRSYLSLVFDLLTKLKAMRDPSGSSILDNTIMTAGHGIDDGQHGYHVSAGRPLIVLGGKNFLHPGNSFDARTWDKKDLWYTASRHLNVGLADFKGSTKMLPI